MKCTNCGRDLPDETIVFCGYCGHRLKSDLPVVNQNPVMTDLRKGPESPGKPKNLPRKKWVWIILIGLFLLFLCVLVAVLYVYFFYPGLYITL